MWDGYLQSCGSGWTHVAQCCKAGSSLHDEEYVCPKTVDPDDRGYDWFRNEKPDLSANGTKTSDRMVSSTKEFLRLHASKFTITEDLTPQKKNFTVCTKTVLISLTRRRFCMHI